MARKGDCDKWSLYMYVYLFLWRTFLQTIINLLFNLCLVRDLWNPSATSISPNVWKKFSQKMDCSCILYEYCPMVRWCFFFLTDVSHTCCYRLAIPSMFSCHHVTTTSVLHQERYRYYNFFRNYSRKKFLRSI